MNLMVAAELKTIETFSINKFKSDADNPYPGRVTSPVTATIFVKAFDSWFLTPSNIYKSDHFVLIFPKLKIPIHPKMNV